MQTDIDKNLKQLQTLMRYHTTPKQPSECLISDNIILLVGHSNAMIDQFSNFVFGANTPIDQCQLLTEAPIQIFELSSHNKVILVVYTLPTPIQGDRNLRVEDLEIDFRVKEFLVQATHMKVIVLSVFGSQHFHRLAVEVKSLLEIVPNDQKSVGLVLMVGENDPSNTENWIYGTLETVAMNRQGLITQLWREESLKIAGVEILQLGNATSTANLMDFVNNKLHFAKSKGISFEVTYPHQVLDTVKGYFNAFNDAVSAFAGTVFKQIIPLYYQQPKKHRHELTGMNATYYEFYRTIDQFEFLNNGTYLPSNLAENLEYHNLKVTPTIINEIEVSFKNYRAQVAVAEFFAIFRSQNVETVEKFFAEFLAKSEGKDFREPFKMLKEKYELKKALMDLDEVMKTRNDTPSLGIHENMDGALTIVEQEIDDRIVKLARYQNETMELHNLFTNIRHWLQMSKLHRTIGTETERSRKVFQQEMQTKLAVMQDEVEHLVKVGTALTVRRSLKNVVAQKLDLYKTEKVNTTEVLSRLSDLKPMMKSFGPWRKEVLSVTNLTQWLSNTTVGLTDEHRAQFMTNRAIYLGVINITQTYIDKFDKVTGEAEEVTWYYERPKPVSVVDNFEFRFNTQNKVFANLMNEHIDEFKEDVVKQTVAEIKENNQNIVDEQVEKLDIDMLQKFRQMFDPDYPGESHIQPLKRLQKIHESYVDYKQFVRSLTLYFGIHHIEMPGEILEKLKNVESEFNKVELALDGAAINTKERWGKNFDRARDFLQNSASSQPSIINSAIRWLADKSQRVFRWPTSIGHATKIEHHQLADVNASLLLADVLTRKLTNSKIRGLNCCNDGTMDLLSAQGHALNVLDKCGVELERRDVDVLSVQKQLIGQILELSDEKDVAFVEYETLKYFNVI